MSCGHAAELILHAFLPKNESESVEVRGYLANSMGHIPGSLIFTRFPSA